VTRQRQLTSWLRFPTIPGSSTIAKTFAGMTVNLPLAITPIIISEAQGVRRVQVVIVAERTPG
jgi:hypothetical protein